MSTSQSRAGLPKGTNPQSSNALTGFHALADLVLALTNADKDGRVLVVPSVGVGLDLWDGHLKFIMLNATKHFTQVFHVSVCIALVNFSVILYKLLVLSACYHQLCSVY